MVPSPPRRYSPPYLEHYSLLLYRSGLRPALRFCHQQLARHCNICRFGRCLRSNRRYQRQICRPSHHRRGAWTRGRRTCHQQTRRSNLVALARFEAIRNSRDGWNVGHHAMSYRSKRNGGVSFHPRHAGTFWWHSHPPTLAVFLSKSTSWGYLAAISCI
ncbi:hypothetical protein JG688_00011207 [Phytophthora aleatoria]|uniref:Uncharacterized protein n=1 Tax=Phytophthora aleatoria TaxID=2496075 RepID=A0A8J5IUX1_9STRA|nr:hypothetical protein JG688_00011207 [Phytophthora aleatoria]